MAQTMNGGIVQAIKPAMKILSAIAPVSCARSPAPALMPTMATKTTRPRSSSTLRAAFGVLPKKRSRETTDDTITPDNSRPPAFPRPIEAPKAGNEIMPIRSPKIMPAESVRRSVAVLVLAMRPHISASSFTADFKPTTETISIRCSSVLRPAGIVTPPRSTLVT